MDIEGSIGSFDSPSSPCMEVRIRQEQGTPITQRFLDLCQFCLGLPEDAAKEYRRTILEYLPEGFMFVEKCSRTHAESQIQTGQDLMMVENIKLDPAGQIVVLAQKIPHHTADHR